MSPKYLPDRQEDIRNSLALTAIAFLSTVTGGRAKLSVTTPSLSRFLRVRLDHTSTGEGFSSRCHFVEVPLNDLAKYL